MPDTTGSPPLSPKMRIWQVVALIPHGKVCSYGQIADYAGLPRYARYVSTALKQAPQSLQLPWHRVINAQGKIAFPPHSAAFREQCSRLRNEGITVNQGRIALSECQWHPDLATLVLSLPF
ncbi:MGMT family protein [Shewanella sp. YIC-542]|uniref:MGMT family protein n=1 Tax=Shewanella mytili TaxID=3377111 RepID=UPI00398E9BFF